MKPWSTLLPLLAVGAVFAAALSYAQNNAPAPVAPAPALSYLTPAQQRAVLAMNETLAPLNQARTAAQAALAAATFTLPGNPADRQAKAAALGAAEQALAAARATAIAQIQSGPSRLSVAQLEDVKRGANGVAGLPAKKRLLIWADTRNGVSQHDFTSHAMAIIERMGYESGLWDTYIRTDSEIISYQPQKTTGGNASGGPSLNNVDAIFSLAHREAPLSDSQKADLLRFVRDGKGFITGHTGLTAMSLWPEFREMIGGDYGGHNDGYGPYPVVVEDPKFPGANAFPPRIEMSEEWYTLANYSREKIHVILRLDLSALQNPSAAVVASGGDFPVAWAREYGKGRVFGSTFAHVTESWDNPMIQNMYFEAIKWALKLQDADVTPRPVPADVSVRKKQ